MGLRKLEAIFEVPSVATADGGELRFRIEIFDQSGRYIVALLRWETIRAQPTFPQRDGEPILSFADQSVLVEDQSLDLSDILADSAEEALARALMKLNQVLNSQSIENSQL